MDEFLPVKLTPLESTLSLTVLSLMLEDVSKRISTVALTPRSARKRVLESRGLTNKVQNTKVIFNCENYKFDEENSYEIQINTITIYLIAVTIESM